MSEVIRGMLNPITHGKVILTPVKLGKMFNLFSVFLLVPLFGRREFFFLIAPNLFILQSADRPLLNGFALYYGLLILPFTFYAFLLIAPRIQARLSRFRKNPARYLVPAVFVLHLLNSRLAKELRPSYWGESERLAPAKEVIATVPRDASVLAQVDLASHFPSRRYLRIIPYLRPHTDYVMFDLEGNCWPLDEERNRSYAAELASSGNWETVQEREGFLLLRRNP